MSHFAVVTSHLAVGSDYINIRREVLALLSAKDNAIWDMAVNLRHFKDVVACGTSIGEGHELCGHPCIALQD